MTEVDMTPFENGAAPLPSKPWLDTERSEPFDRCVVCGCLTEFRVSDTVESRLY